MESNKFLPLPKKIFWMKKIYLKLFIITAIAGSFMMSSCNDDTTGGGSTQPTLNIAEWLADNTDHSHFLDVVKKAQLEDMLGKTDEFTLILPFNADMESAGLFAIDMTQAEARALVLYHLVAGKMGAADFPLNGYFSSESDAGPSGRKLSIYSNAETGAVRLNGIQIESEKAVTNGAIFPYQGVMTPPNLKAHLSNNPGLAKYLTMAASETDANNLFNGTTMFTAFVTRNEPVQKYADDRSTTIGRLKPSDKRAYMHPGLISTKAYHSSEITSGTYTSLAGDISIAAGGGSININNKVTVTTGDIIGTNGIMYILDGPFVE